MERSEIVVFVKVARQVVVEQKSAPYGIVAVFFAYVVNGVVELVLSVVLLVEYAQLRFVLVAQPYRAHAYGSERLTEIVHLAKQFKRFFGYIARV